MIQEEFVKKVVDYVGRSISKIKNPKNARMNANEWVKGDGVDIYIRVGLRFVDGRMERCIDLANIPFLESHQNRGLLTEIIEQLKQFDGYLIAVENMTSERLVDLFRKKGWLVINNEGLYTVVNKITRTRSRMSWSKE